MSAAEGSILRCRACDEVDGALNATLTPAYGRDYRSAKAAKANFEANVDFYLEPEHALINKEQIQAGVTVNLRFRALSRIAVIVVKENR